MKIGFDKIETFGPGVKAYRIVPEHDVPASNAEEADRQITRTDNAKRLGDRLRERLQRHDRATSE